MNQIEQIAERARLKTRPTRDTIAALREERTRLLDQGQAMFLGAWSYADRERWLAEYSSLVRRINEDEAFLNQLEDAA